MKISGFFHGCWVVKIRPTGSSKGPLLLVSLHLFTLHLGRRPWHWFRCKSAGQNLLVWSVLSVWFRSGSCNHTSIIRWEPWTWRGFFRAASGDSTCISTAIASQVWHQCGASPSPTGLGQMITFEGSLVSRFWCLWQMPDCQTCRLTKAAWNSYKKQ